MRISRENVAFWGALLFLVGPFLWLVVGFLIGQLMNVADINEALGDIMQAANELSKAASTKELVAAIFIFLVVAVIFGGGTFYLLMCMIGAVLLLVLRELHELRELRK
jgi:hypothetical protein